MKALRFLFLILSSLLLGCTTLKKPFLYKVTSPDGASGHIFGTIHLGVPVQDLPGSLMDKFEESDPVFLEADLVSAFARVDGSSETLYYFYQDLQKTDLYKEGRTAYQTNDTEKQSLIDYYLETRDDIIRVNKSANLDTFKPAKFANEGTLKSRLPDSYWQGVIEILSRRYSPEQIEELRLESVAGWVQFARNQTMIVSRAKAQRLDPKWSMDLNLQKNAIDRKTVVRTLDGPNSFTSECKAESLLLDIKYAFEKTTEQVWSDFDRLEEVYRSGDDAALFEVMAAGNEQALLKCMLSDRNQAWVPKIESQVKESKALGRPPFFAFGAGHLFGSEGVLSLLEKKGFKIERVEP